MNCHAELQGDLLVLENARIRREYLWHGGVLSTRLLLDKQSGHRWEALDDTSDIAFPNEPPVAVTNATVKSRVHAEPWERAHLEVDVTFLLGGLEVRRVFRMLEDSPAIACELYLRGRSGCWSWLATEDVDGVLSHRRFPGPVLERVPVGQRHLQLECVQFFDRTDIHDTLVQSQHAVPFRFPVRLQGNLLLGVDVFDKAGFFILKEGACSDVQTSNPGCDFIVRRGEALLTGIGAEPQDIAGEEWIRCYGSVTGVATGGRQEVLEALRTYQQLRRPPRPGRDTMIVLNTWGDRGGSAVVNEAFVLREIEEAKRLGVTHLQVDDGWQTGNFSDPGERAFRISEFWDVNRDKFPQGLGRVVEAARKAGIELCLWYAPESAGDYRLWRNNAEILIRFYREYGIRVFKNDGIELPNMRAATNLRKMFEHVIRETQGQAYFNVDVTAGRRLGYHGLSEYGDVFVENRYTDWGNYYPHRTLHNLWQLAQYTPPQTLQMEFLNIRRKVEKYPANDPLVPSKMSFEYCFAICMMSQPLAWFEASGLPAEAFDALAPLLTTYRQHMPQIHAGQIFPIGEAPSGTSWSGFQSENSGSGYVLVFRESNERPRAKLPLRHVAGKNLAFKLIMGAGADFRATTDSDGSVEFALPKPFGFALYQYCVSV